MSQVLATSSRPGLYALQLNGSGDYATFPIPLIPTAGDFSIAVTFRATTPLPFVSELVSQAKGTNFYLGLIENTHFRASDEWSNTRLPFPTDGRWHTVLLSCAKDATQLFLDGRFHGSLKSSTIGNPGDAPFQIGRQFPPHNEFFRGEVAEIVVWKRALNADDAGIHAPGTTGRNAADLSALVRMDASKEVTDQVSGAKAALTGCSFWKASNPEEVWSPLALESATESPKPSVSPYVSFQPGRPIFSEELTQLQEAIRRDFQTTAIVVETLQAKLVDLQSKIGELSPDGSATFSSLKVRSVVDAGALMIRNSLSVNGGISTKGEASVGGLSATGAISAAGDIQGGANQSLAGELTVNQAIVAAGSDLYFTHTTHKHSQRGNKPGHAAIENAEDQDALMILGRSTAQGRRIKLFDQVEVMGTLKHRGIEQVSTLRLKESVRPLNNALGQLMQLNPVTYDWRKETKRSPQPQLGFIAEEVQRVLPSCVVPVAHSAANSSTPDVSPLSTASTPFFAESIRPDALLTLTIAGLQELTRQVNALQLRLDEAGVPSSQPEATTVLDSASSRCQLLSESTLTERGETETYLMVKFSALHPRLGLQEQVRCLRLPPHLTRDEYLRIALERWCKGESL